MVQFCTCGAQLVEDALFCHKCGKPQREDLIERETAPPVAEERGEPPPAAPAPAAIPEINFSNRAAVRISLFCAIASSVLSSFRLGVFSLFWVLLMLLVAGFAAAWFYHRRSGEYLTARAGARIGWMTGLFCWLIGMVLMALNTLLLSSKGGLAAMFREHLASSGSSDPGVQEALKLLESPQGMATVLLFGIFFAFLFFTALPMIGGVLGAKALEKEH